MPGRPPKPTAQKELEGTLRPDRMNPCEPHPTIGVPPMPEHWRGPKYQGAIREWEFCIREIPSGVLTLVDASMLEMYCELRAKVRQTIRRGQLPQTAMVAQVRYLAQSFGLDPSSRSKLVVGPQKELDDFDEWLGVNKGN